MIKNEKMKRRVASSQAERETITEKMAKLDDQNKEKEEEEEKVKEDGQNKKNRNLKMALAGLTLLNMNSISDYFYYSVFMESLSY